MLLYTCKKQIQHIVRRKNMNNKVYAGGEKHLVIINKADRKYDCYISSGKGQDYILKASFKTSTEVDSWLRCEVLPLYK